METRPLLYVYEDDDYSLSSYVYAIKLCSPDLVELNCRKEPVKKHLKMSLSGHLYAM